MVFDSLTDEEIMQLYQNGSEDAFRVLYSRHASKIYGFLKIRVRQTEKVADIYQEVFIKLHRSKHLFNNSLPVLPWIFTITRSVMIDELRKDKKSKLIDDFDIDKIPAKVSEPFFSGEAVALIQTLPDPQKVALQMRYVDDKTFEEIAESLKTSPTNIRQIVSRGIKRLKQLMAERDQS